MKKSIFIAMALLALTGCGVQRHAAQDAKTGIVAHRGFWKCEAAAYSENSIASLAQAQKEQFWGSECDVHITKDGEVVVNHNASFIDKKMTIQNHNYADFAGLKLPNGEGLPTLDEYLDQTAKSKKTTLVIEFKRMKTEQAEDELISKTLEKLKKHKLYNPSRVAFISFSHRACLIIAKKAPGFTNQYLASTTGKALTPEKLHAEGINGIDYHESLFVAHPEWVEEAHKLGMTANVWTVNKPQMMDKMIELGLDQITTNYPLILREKLGSKEIRK